MASEPDNMTSADNSRRGRRLERTLLVSVMLLQVALLGVWARDYGARRDLLALLSEGSRVNSAYIEGVAAGLGVRTTSPQVQAAAADGGPTAMLPHMTPMPDRFFASDMMEYHWRRQGRMDAMLRSVLGDFENMTPDLRPFEEQATLATASHISDSGEAYQVILYAADIQESKIILTLNGRRLTVTSQQEESAPIGRSLIIYPVDLPGPVASNARMTYQSSNNVLKIRIAKPTAPDVIPVDAASL